MKDILKKWYKKRQPTTVPEKLQQGKKIFTYNGLKKAIFNLLQEGKVE